MKSAINSILRSGLLLVKKTLMSSKTIRNAWSDVQNKREFSNLYEHEKMLSDSIRMSTYQKAIRKLVKPGSTVVDLGTGSGILSLFTAQTKPKKIYAIDHSPFIEVAKTIAEKNSASFISFHNMNSRSFKPENKVDFVIHEQIGDDLFDENMIENLLDLKNRVLKKGGKILPGSFELYLEPVALKPEFRVPFIWQTDWNDIDFEFLKGNELLEPFKGVEYSSKYIEPYSVESILCEPQPIFSFDLNDEKKGIDLTLPTQFKKVVNAGQMDGICLYFKVIFDEEFSFDTSPVGKKTHWLNRLYRTEKRSYKEGEVIALDISVPNLADAAEWKIKLSTLINNPNEKINGNLTETVPVSAIPETKHEEKT